MSDCAIQRLWMGSFRNIETLEMSPEPGITLVSGPNGAGKTSVLEAVYLVGRGHSFRTTRTRRVIQMGRDRAWVGVQGPRSRIGVERTPEAMRYRKDGETVARRSELARELPVQLVNADHQRLILDGPAVRRQFLDWGTFHVEPSFREDALAYHQALRQRNAALRNHDPDLARAWIPTLAATASRLDRARKTLLEAVEPDFRAYLGRWMSDTDLRLSYEPAPRTEAEWFEVMERAAERDAVVGHMQVGPHRADLVIRWGQVPVQDVLSRGQQKLLVLALLLAQTCHWHRVGHPAVLLMDDLGAELDTRSLERVVDTLRETAIQTLLTALPGAPEALTAQGFPELRLDRGTTRSMV